MSLFLNNGSLLGNWVSASATANAGTQAPFNPAEYDYVKFTLTGSSWHSNSAGSGQNYYATSMIEPSSIEVTILTTGSGSFSASGMFGWCVTAKFGPYDDHGNYTWSAWTMPSAQNVINGGSSATCRGTAVYGYEWSGENNGILVIHAPGPFDSEPPSIPYKSSESATLVEGGRMHFRTGLKPGWVITTASSSIIPASASIRPYAWNAWADSAKTYTAYKSSGSFKLFSAGEQ